MRYSILITAFLVLAFAACTKNNISKIPQISSVSLSPNEVKAGSSSDTVYLGFHFRDGDADLGNDQSTANYDIFLVDNRNIEDTLAFFFPAIDESVKNPDYGLEGNCTIKLLAAFLEPRPDHLQGDTLHYDLYIKDVAGNVSNHLTTPDIYLLP